MNCLHALDDVNGLHVDSNEITCLDALDNVKGLHVTKSESKKMKPTDKSRTFGFAYGNLMIYYGNFN